MKFLNEKWLTGNKEVAYRIVLRCNYKDQIRNLSGYYTKPRINGLRKQKMCKCVS